MASRNRSLWLVYLNGVPREDLRVISVEQSAGAQRLDNAVLEIDFDRNFALVQDWGLVPETLNVEIERYPMGGVAPEIVHWGQVMIYQPILSQNASGFRLVSRVQPFHFGRPFDFLVTTYRPGEIYLTVEEPVANPVIDDVVQGNRSHILQAPGPYYPFLHPDQARMDRAAAFVGGRPEEWTLSELVLHLCWTLNTQQRYVRNPSRLQLGAVFDDARAPVRNFRMRRGAYLPELLDALLLPLGYRWYVRYRGRGLRQLSFFKRSTVRLGRLFHQRLGAKLDQRSTNVEVLGMRFDKSQTINAITVIGGKQTKEVTIELFPAWPSDKDNLTPEDLRDKEIQADQTKRDVWRKWVGNEAGDYTGLREEIIAPLDLKKIFDDTTQLRKRRQIGPCLTLADDKTPIGHIQGRLVEYSDPLSTSNWIAVEGMGCEILRREIGVRFSGETPPEEIWRQGSTAKVRITGTIEGDTALTYNLPLGRGRQILAAENRLIVYAEGQFQRALLDFSSQFYGKGKATLERDDSAAIREYAEELEALFNSAYVNGQVQLEGCDRANLAIGDSVREIEGINISFRANPGRAPAIYPQIMAIAYDFQKQTTILHLEQVTRRFIG